MNFYEIYQINNGCLLWHELENIKYKHDVFEYWCRILYHRFISRFKFTLPEQWSEEYFKAYLFGKGYIGIIPTENYGMIPQDVMLEGRDIFDRPNKGIIKKPEFNIDFEGYFNPYNENGLLKRDFVLIKCSEDYTGYIDIITFYAHKITLLTSSLDMSIINSRFAYAVAGKDKTSAKTIKAIMDDVAQGKPAVVYDAGLFNVTTDGDEHNWNFLERSNPKQSYLTTDVLNDIQTVLHMFDESIGIANLKDKKERMLSNEVETEHNKALTVAELIIEHITKCFNILRDEFDINCNVELNGEDVDNGGKSNNPSNV